MIGKAELKDSEFVSLMYYTAGPNLFKYFFCAEKDKAIEIIQDLFKTEDTIFSKKYFYVYKDKELGKGAIILIPGNLLHKLEKNIIKYSVNLVRILGFRKYLHSLVRSINTFQLPKVNQDELFVQAISVDEKYRGQHIGSELLQFAEAKVEKNGISKLSLYVEIDNTRAIQVYMKNGFKIVKTVRFSKSMRANKIFGMHKMTKLVKKYSLTYNPQYKK